MESLLKIAMVALSLSVRPSPTYSFLLDFAFVTF